MPWAKQNTAQDSIPYEYLYEDGIAYLGNHEYSMTYSFSDVNYTNTEEAMRVSIFEKYCYALNAFDDTVRVQLHIITRQLARTAKALLLKGSEEYSNDLNHCIREYDDVLSRRITGANSYIREKYITLTIVENDYATAQKRFERLYGETLNLLRIVGCATTQLNAWQRLTLLREYYRPEDATEITAKHVAQTGIYGKDLIAPYGIDASSQNYYKWGDDYVQALFISDLPEDISDGVIHDITSVDHDIALTINIQPQDPAKAMDEVKARLKAMETEKYNVFARQSKAGVVLPEAPADLQDAIDNCKKFREALRTRNEKMFMCNIVMLVRGKAIEDIELIVDEVGTLVKKNGCRLTPFRFDTENALNSIVPLGRNDSFVKRTLNTTALAAFVPFNVVEIMQPGGFSYGKNTLSNNLIVMNRKALTSPHGFIFGSSGSGKSMGAKLEILECFLRTKDDMIIIDPDGEFTGLVQLLGGQEIVISAESSVHFSPFDINEFYGGEDSSPVGFKADFILSLLEVTLHYKGGLDPITRSVIDRCVRRVYAKYDTHPVKRNVPTFRDFYKVLHAQPEQEAQYLSSALEIYVEGSMNIFAEATNVDVSNRLISFNTKNLGKQLNTMAMSIVQDWCWNHISRNQALKKTTWLWNDEIHTSLRNQNTAAWLCDSWKRGRKYGLIATGMTQEVRDVLKSEDAKTLISNSEYVVLYRQKMDMLTDLSQVMQLSDEQVSYLLTAQNGHGLFKAGNSVVQFNNEISSDTLLFKTINTNIDKDVAKGA